MALDAFQKSETTYFHLQQFGSLSGAGPCRPAGQPYEPMDEKMPCGSGTESPAETADYSVPLRGQGRRLRRSPRAWGFSTRATASSAPRSSTRPTFPVSTARRDRLHAAVPSAHRHELGRSPARPTARRILLRVESLPRAGVPLAFGTDYPVDPSPLPRPLRRRHSHERSGNQTYFPENKITRGQALYAYTQGSAYAEFAEQRKGKLRRFRGRLHPGRP